MEINYLIWRTHYSHPIETWLTRCAPRQFAAMFRRVLRLWGLLALVLVGNTAAASLQSARRPIELVLIRQDSKCTIMSIRETQHHKSLSNEPGSFVVENPRSHTSSARETQRIKVYSYDESVLSDHARSICADWDTHLELEFTQYLLQKSFSNQQPLMNEKGHSPPLKIERLIESGPSENRVDLVFFSDGCSCIHFPSKFISPLCLDYMYSTLLNRYN